MLAVIRGEHGMARVILMRRCNIDFLDRRVGAQLLDTPIRVGREIRSKALEIAEDLDNDGLDALIAAERDAGIDPDEKWWR